MISGRREDAEVGHGAKETVKTSNDNFIRSGRNKIRSGYQKVCAGNTRSIEIEKEIAVWSVPGSRDAVRSSN